MSLGGSDMKLQQLKYVIAVAETYSMNEAAKKMFVAQPSLSAAIKELENELGFQIFTRSNRGVKITREGTEFIAYAKHVMEQVDIIEKRFFETSQESKMFSVSGQHYAFAAKALIEYINENNFDSYDFSIRECKTAEVIEDVKNFRSEIGLLSINNFNKKVMLRFLKDNRLVFTPLVSSTPHVFISKGHPLANKKKLTMIEMEDYPYFCYQQKNTDSFYFSEEVLSRVQHKKRVKVDDRATIFNLLSGINGYTIASGMLSPELNGHNMVSIPLDVEEEMTIGYIKNQNANLTKHAREYIKKMESIVGGGNLE